MRSLFGVTSLLILQYTAAYRHYLVRLPNHDKAPCPQNYEQCYGTGICEAVGHENCSPQQDQDDFGEDFEDAEWWTTAFCNRDSDGDGFSNGEELGDPCCQFNMGDGDAYLRTDDLSHPGEAASSPTNAAGARCRTTAPGTVTVTTGDIGATWAQFTITVPTTSCSCYRDLTVTNGAATVATISAVRSSTVTVCDLSATTTYSLNAVSTNLAGSSGASTTSFTTVASGSVPPAVCSVSQTIRPAGAVRDTFIEPLPMAIFVALPFLVILVAGGIACCLSLRNPESKLWNKQKLVNHSEFSTLPITAAVLLCVISTAMAFYAGFQWFTEEAYAYEQKAAVGRGLGYAASWSMGLLLLPVPRDSVWGKLFGTSFERLLYVHRVIGRLASYLSLAHGVVMAVEYSNSKLGLDHIFRWSTQDSLNSLPGTLAGILLIPLLITTAPPIRRGCYKVFRVFHFLWLPILVLTVLHTTSSAAAVFALFIPGGLLLILAFVLFIGDLTLRPTKVVEVRHLPAESKNHCVLVLEKGTPPNWLRSALGYCPSIFRDWVHFRYKPGQYVFLVIPSISVFPHPFTISSAPSEVSASRFSLHIMADGSWTQRLDSICQKHSPAPSRVAGAGAGAGAGSGVGAGAATSTAPVSDTGLDSPLSPAVHPSMPDLQAFPRIMVAGPYGVPGVTFSNYSHLLLIAGGVGVTPIASELSAIQSQFAAGERKNLQSVTVVWSTRSPALLLDFASLFNSPLPAVETGDAPSFSAPRAPVHNHLHLTGKETGKAEELSVSLGTPVKTGRPVIPQLLDEVAGRASEQNVENVAVMMCGPQAMLDAASAICFNGSTAHPKVRFHVHTETFEM